MLYHAYELNHAAVGPLRQLVDLNKRLYESPYNPLSYTLAGRNISAACDLFEAMTRRYEKPAWRLNETSINGCAIPIREREVWRKPFCRLLHFQRDHNTRKAALGKDKADPRVVIIAPLSGHYATLLRGTVEAFLPEHEVYITDWADARQVPVSKGKFDLNTYIDYVMEILRVIGPDAHVVGICQPGPPVLAAIARLAEDKADYLPATMTFMGSPIDTRLSPTVPNRLAQERSYDWFKENVIYSVPWPNKGWMRRVYPGFLQLGGFITMNQDRHVTAHKEYFEHLVQGDCDSVKRHEEFYNEYLAVLDLTEEFYLQTILDVFQEHKLPEGTFEHQGRLIKPEAIKNVALMTVEGEKDDISGIGQTQAAHTLCSGIPDNMHIDYVQPGVGHYGVFSGTRFRTEIQPRMREFMRQYFNAKKERDYQNENPHLTE
ncbi:polyhydroxyalkanoate depolymerase [Agarilytica rhodophyticola]|uniref:polyhydroxyalkanoate depolymerase n=1 Tax=Agarilytica rhodophyticola TaxID=1737490 RepID=UPI000B343201|nr:polyhydroxyalkanoate depolymerase [Agarilytica rhodophyticola]